MLKVIVKKSPIAGKGIFAAQNFKIGEVVFVLHGPIIKYPTVPDWRNGQNWLNIAKFTWKIPDHDNVWNYINHSCRPNSLLTGGTKVVAIRPISNGDEVVIDYSCTEAVAAWKMKCHCRQKNCRGVIRSIQYLPKNLFEKYKNYIPLFLKKEYLQHKFYSGRAKSGSPAIFAKQMIIKNETIFIIKGPVIKYTRPPRYQIGYHWLGISKNIWLIPFRNNPWWQLRHSCDPNVGLKDKTKVVAMRDIRADEELVVDDSITEADIKWHFACHCGSKKCRKTVKSIQFLPQALFKKYKPYIPDFFRQEYLNSRKI
ncbi:MAG: SET domain-containing protein-lysine N-methyltransferase [Patescibacteria group bacterium]